MLKAFFGDLESFQPRKIRYFLAPAPTFFENEKGTILDWFTLTQLHAQN